MTHTATTSFDLAWSPDGRQIAYIEVHLPGPTSALRRQRRRHQQAPSDAPPGGRLGNPVLVAQRADARFTGVGGIYTVHADGTGCASSPAPPNGPKRSPDGRQIAFISERDDPAHRTSDVFVMNADGSGQRNLTHTPNVSEHTTSWAPG